MGDNENNKENLQRAANPGEGEAVSPSTEGVSQDNAESGAERRRFGADSRRGRRRREQASVADFFEAELKERMLQANQHLRSQLTGSILVMLSNSRRQYLVDWSQEQPVVAEGHDEQTDCVITTNEQTLLAIASGNLNPQIAMLSDKISVRGRLSLAVYFFNLIVPQAPQERGMGTEGRAPM